jgi:CheY-like chemotaxis protein
MTKDASGSTAEEPDRIVRKGDESMPSAVRATRAQGGLGRRVQLAGLVECNRDRALIVDDDKAAVYLFRALIRSKLPDIATDVAYNGAEAVAAFGREHHAVLLMDLNMPVMDGREAFFSIERLCRDRHWVMPAVIFCTASEPPNTLSAILQRSPIHCVLMKYAAREALIQAIQSRLV